MSLENLETKLDDPLNKFIDGYNKAKEDYEVVSSVREVHQYKLGLEDGYNKAKERMYSKEEVIKLIQFLSMDKDFNGYGSVSKETANYFLEQFFRTI